MNATNIILKVSGYMGRDCETLITEVFANSEFKTHLVYKLTRYANKYNTLKTRNRLNFKGLCEFVQSLDATNLYIFNAYFGTK